MPDQIGFHRAECRLGGLTAAAHLAKPDQAIVSLNLHDRTHEAAPMDAIGVTQGRLKRHSDSGGADVLNLHGDSRAKQYQLRSP